MKTILILMTAIIIATITTGIKYEKNKVKTDEKFLKKMLGFNILSIFTLFIVVFVPNIALAVNEATSTGNVSNGLGYIAAALSTGLACLGSGIAVGQAGTAAVGAISENESILGKTLIILGLAEGIAIYGLVISIMILTNL